VAGRRPVADDAEVSAADRVMSALRLLRAAGWLVLKLIYVAIAVPLILIFAIAGVAAIFVHGNG
jgi:hypothetical protein